MGLWLIDSQKNRYDILQANIPGGFPAGIKRKLIDIAFGHGAKDIGDQKAEPREIRISSFLLGATGGFIRQIDDCEAVTGWGINYDALDEVLDSTYVKQGSYSLKLGIDADKHAVDYGVWIKNDPIGDWITYHNDSSYYAKMWIYLPTLDYLATSGTAVEFMLLKDGSNYARIIQYTKSQLSVGWNLIEGQFSSASVTGTLNWNDFVDMRIYIYESSGNTVDFEVYADDLKIWRKSYQAEFDDLMRWIGKTSLKFYKDSNRYINVESMDLASHAFIKADVKGRAEILLSCPDPFFYSDSLTTESAWSVTSSPDSKTYFNQGNIEVAPVIEITANADLGDGIELKNQTDGNALFSYGDSAFTSGKKLTVDCQNGTVDLDGTNTLRFLSGQFLRMLDGQNTFQYTGGNCSIVFKHRDRWL